jgi:tRNA A-37 threonylcarbamoyl transferase component Bud32
MIQFAAMLVCNCFFLDHAGKAAILKRGNRISAFMVGPMNPPISTEPIANPPAPPEPPANAPPAVPGYEILEQLGRGGMGVVYKARHTRLDRIVALKVILGGAHAGAQTLARFAAEGRAVAQLDHPNVVQVYDTGEHNHVPFISLEFVDGGSLDRRLAGRPISPREAAELVRVLAEAIHAAHQKGIVHRDLKPANVLLTNIGVPKITDFGLAKSLVQATALTGSGAILGTPGYMAPEQARAQHSAIGPATDVYGLGAILYELLTGRSPFIAENPVDTIMQAVTEPPLPPSARQPHTPKHLDAICLKCLEKSPANRYPSAAALADDLARYLAGDAIQAGRAPPWWSRVVNRLVNLQAVGGLNLVVVGAVLAGGGWLNQSFGVSWWVMVLVLYVYIGAVVGTGTCQYLREQNPGHYLSPGLIVFAYAFAYAVMVPLVVLFMWVMRLSWNVSFY